MNNKLFIIIFVTIVTGIISCKPRSGKGEDISFTIENTSRVTLSNHCTIIDDTALIGRIDRIYGANFEIYADEIYVSEAVDLGEDGTIDEIVFLCNLAPGETKTIKVKGADGKETVAKKTQAELAMKMNGEWVEVSTEDGKKKNQYKGGDLVNVTYLKIPEQNTDNAFFMKYEGVGWESDKVAYRMYLDWRNAVDIFGKKVDTVVLHNVGADGLDSYHEMKDWGVDILKVGNSLGMGSFGSWANGKANRVSDAFGRDCEIVLDGNLKSEIVTNYYGWAVGNDTTNLISALSIVAGSRLTKVVLALDPGLDNICTGIVKHEKAELIVPEGISQGWSYIATWGPQTLQDQNLGMAVFYNIARLKELTADEYSHVVVLTPESNMITYYFAAAWELEKDGIKTKEGFITFLNETVDVLNNPVKISF